MGEWTQRSTSNRWDGARAYHAGHADQGGTSTDSVSKAKVYPQVALHLGGLRVGGRDSDASREIALGREDR